MSNNYCFPHAFDENGYPRIDYEMSPSDYAKYRKAIDKFSGALHNDKEIVDLYDKSECDAIEMMHIASLDRSRLKLIPQDSEICENIPYPISGQPQPNTETLKTCGSFPIITYAVLSYFGKKISLENLAQIADFGGWHHQNGTWWHYLDVVCQVYGLKILHFDSWSEVYDKIVEGDFVAVALLDHEMFPEVRGNSLVLITSIFDGKVSFFHPKKACKSAKCVRESICRFTKYTKVLWGISR